MGRPIFQYELDGSLRAIFNSVRAAAKANNCDHRRICENIKKGKVYKNFHWDYKKYDNYFKHDTEVEQSAKILIFDIETSPILAYTWGVWKQNIAPIQIKEDWKVLTWAAKWLGSDEVLSDAIISHNKDLDDFGVVESLWQLLNEADIVVAHNGKRFDVKKMNARFLYYGLPPTSPYKVVDTLAIAKANFALTYNRMDYIAKFMGTEGKMEHEGFELWLKCMANDKSAWRKMLDYNEKDVEVLENIYLDLRAWDSRHPSVSIYKLDTKLRCTKCGSDNLTYEKDVYTNTRAYALYRCQECHGFSRSRSGVNKKALLMTQ